jgi:hypothetical protein
MSLKQQLVRFAGAQAGFYYRLAIGSFHYSENATLMPEHLRYKFFENFPSKTKSDEPFLTGEGKTT